MTRRTGYLVVAVLLAHLILVSTQVSTASGVSFLQFATFGVLSEAQRGLAGAIGSARQVWDGYLDLRGLKHENDALRMQVTSLEVAVQQQRALAARADRLQSLLELRTEMHERTVAAEVIAGDATAFFHTVVIDKGAADGLTADMAVIGARGVVGRVIGQPARKAARVQLLVDRFAAAGAVLERTRTGGIVVGEDGDPPLRMQYVSNLADVQVGDTVVTSGIDGIYPKGYVIGSVETVTKGSGLYLDIRVRPRVDFSSVEEVLVVLDRPPAEHDAPEGRS
ncbi:MAG: rod shape-determining protein MreC [Vicinamibacterales bacterium]